MSNKELVIEAIRKLPEDMSLHEISERIAILAALEEAEQDVAAGRLVSQEEVERRLSTWLSR